DIERQKQNEQTIHHLSEALQQSPTSVLICDQYWRIAYANTKFSQATGRRLADILGQHPRSLLLTGADSLQSEHAWHNIEIQVNRVGVWQGELQNIRPNGERCWEQLTITPIRDEG